MAAEVQYERMAPRGIVAAREKCPIAYLPVGTIEWHGQHNPVGLDAIKAHRLAVRCAESGGGLVFPPLWYGESRVEGLMEAGAVDREAIHEAMQLPSTNFGSDYFRTTPQVQYENYQRLLVHCFTQIQSLGFKVIIISAGHYPLIDHVRAACAQFHQMRWHNRRAQTITWAFTGYELVKDEFPEAGDHAGFWETSLLMALEPELVDMSALPADTPAPLVGVQTARPVQESSREYGEQAIRRIVERVTREARDRLENPKKYYAHGWQS